MAPEKAILILNNSSQIELKFYKRFEERKATLKGQIKFSKLEVLGIDYFSCFMSLKRELEPIEIKKKNNPMMNYE